MHLLTITGDCVAGAGEPGERDQPGGAQCHGLQRVRRGGGGAAQGAAPAGRQPHARAGGLLGAHPDGHRGVGRSAAGNSR